MPRRRAVGPRPWGGGYSAGALTEPTLTPELARALATRHVAHLATRLVDDRAKDDFRRSFENAYDHLLTLPLRQVVDAGHVADAVDRLLTADLVRGVVAPIARAVHARVLEAVRAEDATLGTFVPEEARAAIDRLLDRSDLVPEAVIRQIAQDPATDLVLHDVLYDALVEFNDVVNPFFADWGLPALVKKVMPIGSGTVLKSLGLVRGEFDKRLEPEIRKFLLAFFRRSKSKFADLVVTKSKDPAFGTLRKNAALVLYEQSLSELVRTVDAGAERAVDDAAVGIATAALDHERPRAAFRAAVEELVRSHGDRPLGDVLAAAGVASRPDLQGFADALWPTVALLLASPPARAFYERVTWEFYDGLVARS